LDPDRQKEPFMTYALPADVDQRPVAIIGAGTLGRRIAAVYAASGSDVRIFDLSGQARDAACRHVDEQLAHVQRHLGLRPARRGIVEPTSDLRQALGGAWMSVEAVPEQIATKTAVFADLDRLAEPDAVLCSNSSSLPTRLMISGVNHPQRVLNTHYYMPPEMNAVELMSCGQTDQAVIDALMGRLPGHGFVPFRVRRESDGFIFNRIWASIKRECLLVVEEGVAAPEDVDALWRLFAGHADAPFRLMDRIGLDIVLAVEEHYADVRDGIPEGPRRLLREYIEQGRLGVKSGRGFYDEPVS
jgi:3-hydroxybutyryl-CoA dehydrogenase